MVVSNPLTKPPGCGVRSLGFRWLPGKILVFLPYWASTLLAYSPRQTSTFGAAKPECDRLKRLLAECGRGERFIVQGGDCAERFMDCEAGCSACSVETKLFFFLSGSSWSPFTCQNNNFLLSHSEWLNHLHRLRDVERQAVWDSNSSWYCRWAWLPGSCI